MDAALSDRPARFYVAALALITAAGILVRVAAARGDLWLDEIWSLQTLEKLSRADEIFYGVSQDNNHFLNSLWLWCVGPQPAPLVARILSVALGAAAIPLAAEIARRAGGAAAGVCAALLFAFGYAFVLYGSEARGYAGLILAALVAIFALDRHAENPRDRRPLVMFGAAAFLGALFHLTMVFAVFALSLAAFARFHAQTRDARAAMRFALPLAGAGTLGLAPAGACVVASILYTHKMQTGDQHAFAFERLAAGLASAARIVFGLPFVWSDATALILALIVIAAALALLPAPRRVFFAVAILAAPSLAVFLQLPNLHIPRFHLVSAVAAALAVAEGLGALFARSRPAARVGALAVLAACLAGDGAQLRHLLLFGRGQPAAAVAAMSAAGPALYDSNGRPETIRVVRYYAGLAGADLRPADFSSPAAWCAAPPQWFVRAQDPEDRAPSPPILALGAPDCAKTYEKRQFFPSAEISGAKWTLYRLQ
ncbi:MAG: glycosyltransferase family 39 protein [Hyphomicrobiales bacterium]|nr:glycosyltransferase family 39 protein [Hyphomicrobiales bacterium]